MTGWELRTKRLAAGVSGSSICQRIGKSRSWLTGVERGYTKSTEEDRARVAAAIDDIIQARLYIADAAAKARVSLIGVVTAPDAFASATMMVDATNNQPRGRCSNARPHNGGHAA